MTPDDRIDRIEISQRGCFANTEDDPTMRPIDHIIHPNRHERRKAGAFKRRLIRKGHCDWCA